MCRIFGFKSVIPSQMHKSLVGAENALMHQSTKHPHGWGVAYYIAGCPHIVKSVNSAIEDRLFQRVSGVVAAHTVVAHIRKATHGIASIVNTHPFQYGPWVFMHNGHIDQFQEHKEKLLTLVNPKLRRLILGDTDSEVIFYIFMTEILKLGKSLTDSFENLELANVFKAAIGSISNIVGEHSLEDLEDLNRNYLSILLTNGQNIMAYNGGKNLYYSTYKHYCSERETCPSLNESCEAKSKTGFVNHMIFSSEPLHGENIWLELPVGQLVGVDGSMRLYESEA